MKPRRVWGVGRRSVHLGYVTLDFSPFLAYTSFRWQMTVGRFPRQSGTVYEVYLRRIGRWAYSLLWSRKIGLRLIRSG